MTITKQFTAVDLWIPMQGLWETEGESITFTGSDEMPSPSVAAQVPSDAVPIPLGVARSNVWFGSGTLKTTVTLPLSDNATYGRVLLGFRSWGSRFIAAGIGSIGREAYIIEEFNPGSPVRWQRLAGTGNVGNLKVERPESIEIGLEGQNVTVSVNGAMMLDCVLGQPLERGQIALLAYGGSPIKFGPVEVETRLPSAFVVMQFTSPFNELFEEVIQPVCDSVGIDAYRASDIYRPGVILQDIIEGLAESNVIVAEITPANANVFYELGYAHALNKPVILLAERGTALPFDVSGYRVIFYENAIKGKSSLEAELRRHLSNIFNG